MREVLRLIPGRAVGRQHHVQALAAGGFHEALELQVGEPFAQLARRAVHGRPRQVLAGIEIEHDPVAVFDSFDGRAPHVNFQHARLHQREQAVEIVDVDQLLAVAVLVPLDAIADQSGGCMLLEEALPADAFGAAHQRERPADEVRRDVLPHRGVIVGELLLGDLDVGPVDAVRVGEFHRSGFCWRCCGFGGLRGGAVTALPARFLGFAVGIGFSCTTSLAGLSSRSPLNAAWRMWPCAVKPVNSTSATSFGSTQMPLPSRPRPRSSSGSFPKAGVPRRSGWSFFHKSRATCVV
jgi:hypothetical protein